MESRRKYSETQKTVKLIWTIRICSSRKQIRCKCHKWKNIKIYTNNRLKIISSTWNSEFKLTDGSYPVWDVQVYIEYIIKHETLTTNPPIFIYINPFVPNAPFFYPPKTSENLTVFLCFQRVEKECIGNEWVNNIKNILVFKIKDGCKLELQTCETMKFFGSTEKKYIKQKLEQIYPVLKYLK